MKKLNCVIIDDEEIDRLMVIALLKKFEQFQLIGAFESGEDALRGEAYKDADILFLDIDMDGMNGLEFRKIASEVPACIFITSHPEYALESFALETLDYIMKPLRLNRFEDTVKRIDAFFELREKASFYENSISTSEIYIKEGTSETKVNLNDIIYLEALKDYTQIFTKAKKHYVLSSIGNLLKQTEFEHFIRIHRSYAVHKDAVQSFNQKKVVLHENISLPVGRNFKDNLKEINPKV